MNGTVKWFDPKRGFGFIGLDEADKRELGIPAEKDLFVHARNVIGKFPKNLYEGQEVEFDVVPSKHKQHGGWEADEVRVISTRT